MPEVIRRSSTDIITVGTLDEGMSWIGRTSGPVWSTDRVEAGAVRHFCELVRDDREQYHPDRLLEQGHELHAPNGSLLLWCLPPTWSPGGDPDEVSPWLYRRVPLPFDHVVALGAQVDFHAPLVVGRRLSFTERITAITPKRTRLGDGALVSVEQVFSDDQGARVGTHAFTVLRFQPDEEGNAGSKPRFEEPRLRGDHGFDYSVSLETCALLVSATRDYNPLHYDRDFARDSGAPDVFLNTHTYMGLFDRLVGEWSGGRGVMTQLQMRMVNMNCPGDVAAFRLRPSGSGPDGARRVELEVSNDRVGITTVGEAAVTVTEA